MDAQTFKERDAASYDEHAPLYAKYIERLAGPLADRLCALAALRPRERVLDVGCGTGIATRRAAAITGDALGVDLSPGMVEEARRRGWAQYRVMDAEALELEDASFDVVLSLCAVAHFPDLPRALAEMRRVLKPGGRLALGWGSRRRLDLRALRRRLPGTLAAPEALMSLVRERLPEPGEPALTEAGRTGPRVKELLPGFELREEWLAHEVEFESAEEFWEAQAAIVTEARKRLLAAPPEVVDELREEFLRRARGKRLVYPYQAVFVTARSRS